MKNYLIISLFSLTAASPLLAQNTQADFQSLYKTAVSFKDTSSMTIALLGMVNSNPADTVSLKALAILYSNNDNYYSSALAAKKYLELRPDNVPMLQLYAVAAQNCKLYEEALIGFTELFFRTKDIYYKYMAAFMEYELFRQEDCLKTLKVCLDTPGIDKIKINGNLPNGEVQLITLQVLCLNLKGLVYIDTKDYKKAGEAFEQALAINPEFETARQNLKEVNSLKEKK